MDYAIRKIAGLVLEYTKRGKFADETFVDQVLTLLVNAIDVDDFVLDCKYKVSEELLGGYDPFTRVIYIDMNKLLSHIKYKLEEEKINGIINNNYEFILKYNLSFVNTIAHEVYHASQYKKIFDNKECLEKELLKLSFEHNIMVMASEIKKEPLTDNEVNYIVDLGRLENDYMYLNALPSERMACIDASMIEKKIANEVTNRDRITDYMNVKYNMEQIRGYLNGNCPTAYIISVHNKMKNAYGLSNNLPENLHTNELNCIDLADMQNLSLNEKYYYGFYISGEELKTKIDKINYLTKKLINKS